MASYCQGPGFSLVLENNTQHIDNSLNEKIIDFFKHHPVRPDISCDLAGEWTLWGDRKGVDIIDHFRHSHSGSSYIVRLSFNLAPEINADAIKLTFSIWNLRSQDGFADVDVLYMYNDENITETILPLILGHLYDILCGSGKKQHTLYLRPDDMLAQNCHRFPDIFVQFFKKADLYKSFCLIGGDKSQHHGEIFGELEKKHKKQMMKFTYSKPNGNSTPIFEADCDCNLQSIEAAFIGFIHKIIMP